MSPPLAAAGQAMPMSDQNTRRQFLPGSTLAASAMLATPSANAAECSSKDYQDARHAP
jgi:hypothetical protein